MLLWGRNTFGQCGNDPATRKTSPPSLLCVDEAYADFCDVTAMSIVAQHPNLMVCRTFSR